MPSRLPGGFMQKSAMFPWQSHLVRPAPESSSMPLRICNALSVASLVAPPLAAADSEVRFSTISAASDCFTDTRKRTKFSTIFGPNSTYAQFMARR